MHHASTSAVAEKQAWDRAAASGSAGPAAAKEDVPLLMWAPDVEDVPLPPNLKRGRAEDSEVVVIDSDSEEAVWDPMALQRWHDRRQMMESSAVADKASSAVADKGRTLAI